MIRTGAQAKLDNRLPYNFVQANYYEVNPGNDSAGHGKGVDGSTPWGKRSPFYTLIRYCDSDNDYGDNAAEMNRTSPRGGEVGVGRHQAINETMDWTPAAVPCA